MSEKIMQAGKKVKDLLGMDKEQPHQTIIERFSQTFKDEDKLYNIIDHYLSEFYKEKKFAKFCWTIVEIATTWLIGYFFGVI